MLELVYVGQLDSPLRGVDVLLNAVAKCNRRAPRIRVTLIGDGRERASLMSLASRLDLGPHAVRFAGRLPHREALDMLSDAHVGVVLHLATEHTNTTVANKLFDYMAAGLAVLSSSAGPMARIVTDSSCGEVTASGDTEDTVNAIDRLWDDDHRYKCAVAGWEAASTTYHWERDVDRLRSALETATQSRPGRTPA
jgi:glycosyltransferase involved in cell wall biosynthesis